jgi:hypothetical protein
VGCGAKPRLSNAEATALIKATEVMIAREASPEVRSESEGFASIELKRVSHRLSSAFFVFTA